VQWHKLQSFFFVQHVVRAGMAGDHDRPGGMAKACGFVAVRACEIASQPSGKGISGAQRLLCLNRESPHHEQFPSLDKHLSATPATLRPSAYGPLSGTAWVAGSAAPVRKPRLRVTD